jgi:hypothetical protein
MYIVFDVRGKPSPPIPQTELYALAREGNLRSITVIQEVGFAPMLAWGHPSLRVILKSLGCDEPPRTSLPVSTFSSPVRRFPILSVVAIAIGLVGLGLVGSVLIRALPATMQGSERSLLPPDPNASYWVLDNALVGINGAVPVATESRNDIDLWSKSDATDRLRLALDRRIVEIPSVSQVTLFRVIMTHDRAWAEVVVAGGYHKGVRGMVSVDCLWRAEDGGHMRPVHILPALDVADPNWVVKAKAIEHGDIADQIHL